MSYPQSDSIYTVSNYIWDRLFQLGVRQFFALPGDYAAFLLKVLEPGQEVQRISNTAPGYASQVFPGSLALASLTLDSNKFPEEPRFAASSGEHEAMVLIAPGRTIKECQCRGSQSILLQLRTGNRVADQQVLQHAVAAAVIIRDADTAPQLIDYALTAMITHRRPVSIEVLHDVEVDKCSRPQGRLQVLPGLGESKSLGAMLDAVWACIAHARLPVIWVGADIARHGLQELVQQIIDISGILFTTHCPGQSGLDETSLQFIGAFNEQELNLPTLMNTSDCVLALGAQMSDDYLHIMMQSYEQTIEVNDTQARIAWSKYPDVHLQVFLQGLLQRLQLAHPVAKNRSQSPGMAEITAPVASSGMFN
jgi:indolepyruvate decarboxylase